MRDDKPQRLRTGRSVGRTIYVQTGDEPSKEDELVGVMDTPQLAELVCVAVNAVQRVRTEASGILRIVNEWCVEANDVGGVDAGDLAWRLERAGHPLPAPEDSDA